MIPMLGNYIICCSIWESGNEAQLSLSSLTICPSPSSHSSSSLLSPKLFFESFSVPVVILSCKLLSCLIYHYSKPFPSPHGSRNDLYKNKHIIRPVPLTLMGLTALPKLASAPLSGLILCPSHPCLHALACWVSFNYLNSSCSPTSPSTQNVFSAPFIWLSPTHSSELSLKVHSPGRCS